MRGRALSHHTAFFLRDPPSCLAISTLWSVPEVTAFLDSFPRPGLFQSVLRGAWLPVWASLPFIPMRAALLSELRYVCTKCYVWADVPVFCVCHLCHAPLKTIVLVELLGV